MNCNKSEVNLIFLSFNGFAPLNKKMKVTQRWNQLKKTSPRISCVKVLNLTDVSLRMVGEQEWSYNDSKEEWDWLG